MLVIKNRVIISFSICTISNEYALMVMRQTFVDYPCGCCKTLLKYVCMILMAQLINWMRKFLLRFACLVELNLEYNPTLQSHSPLRNYAPKIEEQLEIMSCIACHSNIQVERFHCSGFIKPQLLREQKQRKSILQLALLKPRWSTGHILLFLWSIDVDGRVLTKSFDFPSRVLEDSYCRPGPVVRFTWSFVD